MRMKRFIISGTVVAVLACAIASGVRAEFRTWSAAAGNFTTEAEYVGKKSADVIVLKRRDGAIIDVPLSKLSAADQAYVTGLANGTPSTTTPAPNAPAPSAPAASASPSGAAPAVAMATPAGLSAVPALAVNEKPMDAAEADRALRNVDREAQKCKTAEEAIVLYTVFLSDPKLPAATRAEATQKAAEWKRMAEQGLVRLGAKWVTLEEFRQARVRSVFLINQGLEMVRLNQDKLGFDKLLEASKVAPDDIQADFIIATVFAIGVQKFEKAEEHYKVCLRRDPTNPAVLNNLALTLIRQNKPVEALGYWRTAASLCHDPRIVQNIGRLFEAAGSRKLFVTPAVLDQLSDIYATLVLDNNVSAATKQMGWQYMVLPQQPPVDETTAALPADTTIDKSISVMASGFCPVSEYILTTRDATKGSSGFVIADPNQPGKRLEAKLIASSESYNLSILHCPGLTCTPLPMDDWYSRIGTDILVASYPMIDTKAASIKMAKGKLISPSSQFYFGGHVVYEAPKAPSVPGGPVVDSMGNVVAMHLKSFEALNNRYNAGINVWAARDFIRDSIPNARFTPVGKADLPWSDIEKQAAQATVVVMCEQPASDVGLNKRVGDGFLIDVSCSKCSGMKTVRCPVRDCANGKVGAMKRTITGRNPTTGQTIYQDTRVSVPCDNCDGRGRVTCPECRGSGIDSSVSSRPRGMNTANPINGLLNPN